MTSNQDSRVNAPPVVSRDESLLDDAIDDTFPASDPVAHGQPGSIVNLRYAALEQAERQARRSNAIAGSLLLIGAASACAFLLARRRKV